MRILTVSLFLILGLAAAGQTGHGFDHYNKLTYKQYQNGDWQALADTGSKALQLGFDAYYFRMRTGEAFYNLKRYRKADRHFAKALQFSKGDPEAAGFYYESALLGGKTNLANAISDQYSAVIFGIQKNTFRLIDRFYGEGAVYLAPANIPAGPLYYGHGGIQTRITPKIRLYNGYSTFYQLAKDTFYTEQFAYSPYEIYQSEYLESLSWMPHRNLSLSQNAHFQWIYIPEQITFNWVAGISGMYSTPLLDISAGWHYGSLADSALHQFSAGVTIYPLQNANFFLSVIPTYLFTGNRLLTEYQAGVKLTNHLWVEGSYHQGPLAGSASWDDFYLYNNYDPMLWYGGITLKWFSDEANTFGISYFYYQRESVAHKRQYPQHMLMLQFMINSKK